MLPSLKSQILKWGLLAQWLYWAKYLQAILACPAIFCPDTGVFSYLLSGYGQFTLFPCQPFFIFLKNPAFSISISFFIKTVLFWSFILSTVFVIPWIALKNKRSFLFFCNSSPTCRGKRILKWKTKFQFWTKCKSKFHIGRSYFCTHICHIVFDNHYSV